MPDVITMGEALIDFVPGQVDCPLKEVRDFHRAAGGAPANVAVGLVRLGCQAGFMGKVGSDAFGYFLKDTLQDNGVDISQLAVTDEAMTTLAFVSLRSDGERDFAFYRKPGADMLYRAEEIDLDYLAGANIFHFGSISQIAGPVAGTTLELVQRARENGSLISYDPNIRPPLWGSMEEAVNTIRETIPLADIVKLSEEELTALIGLELELPAQDYMEEWEETLVKLRKGSQEIYEQGPGLVVITLGRFGSFYYAAADSGYVAAPDVQAVDTTGAGDGFVAALLSRINQLIVDEDWPGAIPESLTPDRLESIISFANRVGSVTTTRNGGIPSLPTLAEVEEFRLI